jgi:hypothetical protein
MAMIVAVDEIAHRDQARGFEHVHPVFDRDVLERLV